MNNLLITPIEFLKGVGPKKADLLKKELRIFTFNDLLTYFPFRYIDRSQFHKVSDLIGLNGPAQLKGKIVGMMDVGSGRGKRLTAQFQDESGMINLVWFKGASWIKKSIKINEEIIVYGRPKQFGGKWNIPHPEMSSVKMTGDKFQPVYSSTELLSINGMDTKGIEKLTGVLLDQIHGQIEELLPESVIQGNRLIGREQAILKVHRPKTEQDAQEARLRLKFEELFFLQMELLVRKKITIQKSKGVIMTEVGDVFNDFYKNHIPFELTGAQKKVLKEIRHDLNTGHHMNRLLQGDVGSGKTLVALLTMLLGIGNGFQAALMAPTEILAIQHNESISEMMEKLDIKVALLTGSTKKKDRIVLHEKLQSGEIDILIGTHALLEDVVQFKNLGIVVIDEQHRFGVAQRARMWKKNDLPPHVLIMTATPIPRTLAMTFYGDLDVSVIDELPPGRKPITTLHRYDNYRLRVFGFMKEEIAKGRQVYIVYPLINESKTLDFNNLMDGFEAIKRTFPMPDFHVSIVHGQMKPADKEFEMNRFIKGETQIMVATTVIEVGVNVPNASVMIIESAERFGLSQLHQLRGRVGRGAEQSYCILMTGDEISKDSLKRMKTMVKTNDGFEIAEVDLQLRGPGDLLGTQQSGILDLKIANLSTDSQIVGLAREVAKSILIKDPAIEMKEHKGIRSKLTQMLKSRPNWGRIA
ncbi:MAG: ATP-dependent DNA helicase RecG [Crocinitomicaceae bacterium]|nr:ATP-dependent DNA helicase RecG [Crocinitomicaceae bacterium]MDC1384385.1 ATP-dependent DNA helicase RecG [Crocinitomicaceae bacterium]|tara:strand:+ start:9019 stop:11109 length:2091 start_codon:yes stop_codon:yes gene_type:complete